MDDDLLQYYEFLGEEGNVQIMVFYNCNLFSTVAESTSSGSPVVQRVRLQEQAENQNTGNTLMDDDLLQYYEFLGEKGDVQAQVGVMFLLFMFQENNIV